MKQESRKPLSAEDAAAYSIFVTRLKVGVAIAASLLIIILIAWPLINNSSSRMIRFSESPIDKAEEKPRMINPRLDGVDGSNRPYAFEADEAVQQSDTYMIFKGVKGSITIEGESEVLITSKEGHYSVREKKLQLKDDVVIESQSDQITITTPVAYIDLNENLATSNQPVKIDSPLGKLSANGFVIRNEKASILFYGGVELNTQMEQ